jgi:DNA-binding cell septation regulator SpoVG
MSLEDNEPDFFTSFTFSDTNWFKIYSDKKSLDSIVYDVELPHGEPFIATKMLYGANKVILSNPRRLCKKEEFADIYHESEKFIRTHFKTYPYKRHFIADKDSNHKLVGCSPGIYHLI